jgi:hypothetical protein
VIGTGWIFYKGGNEKSGFVKCGEFFNLMKTGQLLKKDSAPWSKEEIK